MSRITNRKLEKAKVKVVFRLQFHATHVPQTGWDKLFVSFISADSGKATAKTSKSNVRNGTCKWADPIYETTRLLQDTKTKVYDEKVYKLVVAMGSSRSSLLGEANINLADFSDASKPSVVALPLHGCNYGTVLHVIVQLLTSKTGFREFEQQRELREGGLVTTNSHSSSSESVERLSASTERNIDQNNNKAAFKVRFKSEPSELPSLVEEAELNEDYAESATGIDDSSNTSESLYTERNDSNTHEIDSQKSTISGDLGGTPISQGPHSEKGDPPDHRILMNGSNDWVHGWSSDFSMENDLSTAYEEDNRLRASLEVAESSLSELKLEMITLKGHADELGAETEKFSQLLAKERASGEELGREVSVLKSECSKLKVDFEELNHSRSCPLLTGGETVAVNQDHLIQILQTRLLQCLLDLEDKVNEVQKKACLKHDDMDLCFLQPDLDALQLVLKDLMSKTSEVTSILNVLAAEQGDIRETGPIFVQEVDQTVSRDKLGGLHVGQYHHKGNCHHSSKHGDVSPEPVPVDAMHGFEGKISDLERNLVESKAEQDSLTRKMDQMECYYEALVQELEENQKQMLGDLQNLRNEHSTCLYTITSCNTQMEKMHQDMNEQLLRFSEDRHALEFHSQELERRAVNSEMAFEKARWNYSLAVDQLQKDLELLSFQVLSMFEINENIIRQAFTDAPSSLEDLEENLEAVDSSLHKDRVPFLQKHHNGNVKGSPAEPDTYHRTDPVLSVDDMVSLEKVVEGKKNVERYTETVVEIQNDTGAQDSSIFPEVGMVDFGLLELDVVELEKCRTQNIELKRELMNEKIHFENLKRSLYLQEGRYEKAESERSDIHLINIDLDVFSMVLQGALIEANKSIKLMKGNMIDLETQLAHSVESNELLMLNFQKTLEDVNTLRESCSTQCDELLLQNQTLQEKLQGMCDENDFLSEQIREYERLMAEHRSEKDEYEACLAEKTELVNLLNREALEKCSLQNEVGSMNEELTNLKADLNHQSLIKANLEKTISSIQDKLWDLRSTMILHTEQMESSFPNEAPQEEREKADNASTILQVQKLQQKALEKIIQLMREKKEAEEEREIVQRSLSDTKSEIQTMKQKYESDIQNMANKLISLNAIVEKLQLETKTFVNKLKSSTEVEERHAEMVMDISSKLSTFEFVLHQVSAESNDLTQKILALESVSKELERVKLTLSDSLQENLALKTSLQEGNEKVVNLESELYSLKCFNNELLSERSLRGELEGRITVLASELNMRNDQLNSIDLEKDQVAHLKQLVLDLESENARVCHLLLQSEESRKKADVNASFFRLQFTDLETHLTASHEHILAADVEITCMRNQFQTRMKELVQQLESLDRYYRELHLKHLDVLTSLNGRISTEVQYAEENARSLTVLNSLKTELEVTIAEKSALVDRNNDMLAEIEIYKTKESSVAVSDIQDKQHYELEVEQLKLMLLSSEEAIDNLTSSKDELDITVTVLRAKLAEQHARVRHVEKFGNELITLQVQNNELSQRLSDQFLKTEEFKNLSVHLKELKDKAENECLQAREKKENTAPLNPIQESLRIAFIREQCDTKLQEIKGQLFISTKHGEEMLLKLQDALNEVENRKKTEASHIKKIEQLSLKILELETELQKTLAENRACDEMKAELECSLISLDCCKEEKQKLEMLLQESTEERMKIAVELGSLKDQLKSSDFPTNNQDEGNLIAFLPTQPINKEAREVQGACKGAMQDCHNTSRGMLRIRRQVVIDQDDLTHLTLLNDHFKAKSLRSSMEHLHEQLERMKNENMDAFPEDSKHLEPAFHGLQRQLLQLHKANEQLGSIFPLFNEYSSSGNALERVLALEIELAEALLGKKKSNVLFQSSFLKQHPDEEAVFQSFRDINELIEDMLEVKGRYTTVEAELKEMHDRYSQLSLRLAEVEGERQKLVMTLKNIKSPKKTPLLCDSMPASLEENL